MKRFVVTVEPDGKCLVESQYQEVATTNDPEWYLNAWFHISPHSAAIVMRWLADLMDGKPVFGQAEEPSESVGPR